MAWRDGELLFSDARGRELPASGVTSSLAVTAWDPRRGTLDRFANGIKDPEISAETNRPGWDGVAIDYELCLRALAS